MADFPDATKTTALSLAGSKCERCKVSVTGTGTDTHYHHKVSELAGGSNGLSNCEVLCIKCHKDTASYGRH